MLLIVGGHSRNIGKTSVVCGIIAATSEANWTAVKITQYGQGVCSHEGAPCECADPVHPIAISEERGDATHTDSGRFLASGARRALWLRTPAGKLGDALPKFRRLLATSENCIVESNSLLQFLKPDLCLMVLDGAVPDFKLSSRRFLDRADALLVVSASPLAWPGVAPSLLARKPIFPAPPPAYRNSTLIETGIRPLLNLSPLKLQPLYADITHG